MLNSLLLKRDLLWLYFGKFGAALVALLAIPIFTRLMGSEEFGRFSLILSLQALVIMLDWGTSTLLVRQSAFVDDSNIARQTQIFRSAQKLIAISHAGLLVVLLPLLLASGLPVSRMEATAMFLLFLMVALLNLSHTALVIRNLYAWAGMSQIVGTASRFGLALLSVYVGASLLQAVGIMAAIAMVNVLLNQWKIQKAISGSTSDNKRSESLKEVELTNRWLVVQSVFSALAIHFDKSLVALFSTPSDTATFYLATSLAILPITFFVFPIVQFCQSKIMSLARSESPSLDHYLMQYTKFACIIGAGAALLMALFAEPISALWIGGSNVAQHEALAQLLRPMVLAAGFGALGFLPNIVLTFHERYAFQCYTHIVLTSAYLLSIVLLVDSQLLKNLSWAFAAYHVICTCWIWLACVKLNSNLSRAAAASLRSNWMLLWLPVLAWLAYSLIAN